MLREGLQYLKEQFGKSVWDEFDRGGHPDALVLVNSETGDHKVIPDEPARTMVKAHSLDAFVKLSAGLSMPDAKVLVCSSGAVCVLDAAQAHPRSFVWWSFEEFEYLKSLSKGITRKPKDLAKFIDVELHDCIIHPEGLAGSLRDVKFSNSENKTERANHGDEGLSMEVKRQVSGATDIPSSGQIDIDVCPHMNGEVSTTVKLPLDVHINVDDGTVRIKALPGTAAAARRFVVAKVIDAINSGLANNPPPHGALQVFAGEWESFPRF